MSTYVPSVEDSDAMTDIHSRMHGLISRAIPMNFRDEENLNDLLITGQDEAYECGRKRGKSDADAREAATRAEVEDLRADAERYRWLRDNAVSYPERDDALELVVPVCFADKWAEMTDSAIDAARSGVAATSTKKD